MPVAFAWITLHTQHGDWITEIQEAMQVSGEVTRHHGLVVPVPDRFPASALYGASAHVAGNPPLSQMKVRDAVAIQGRLQVALAQFGPIHADGIEANIDHALHARATQRIK